MFQETPVLLITGATGLVGGELLKHLGAAKSSRRIVALTRQTPKISELNLMSGVVAHQGDITRPNLGVDDRTCSQLKASVAEVVHCAADTRFGLSLESAQATNTQGTWNVLKFASECRGLRKFAYVSTVYVVGRSTGYFDESSLRHASGFCNTYQQSKFEAEVAVMQAMGDFPAVIFRLSSIIGDSRNGRVQQFNHVHRLVRLLPQNVLPIAPGDPEAPIDLIATDWAIPALAYLFDFAFVPANFYHICAGPDRSLTVREMIELTVSIFESHPLGRRWLPIQVPRLVPLSQYEKFVQTRLQGKDKLLNDLLRVLGYFVPHLAMFQTFDNRNATAALKGSGLRFPPIREYYRKVVESCLETNWGRRRDQECHR